MTIPFIEENDQTRARHEHLEELRQLVGNVYPNKFQRSHVTQSVEGQDTITSIVKEFGKHAPQSVEGALKPSAEEIGRVNEELNKTQVRLSGRVSTPPRVMGKAAFVHLSDGVSRLQIYVRKADARAINNDTGAQIDDAEAGWKLFNLIDHGDFIGVAGYLFITKTGELSVHVTELQFLAKALLPMPDKLHGIADPEIRQRQRYADLIAGSLKIKTEESDKEDAPPEEELTTRQVFERRSKIIREMRRFLDDHGYIEVETPMLTPQATGAAAEPFETYHKALGIKLYARIAPELYLKRLLVGGFERVYELNRNFRNEGISTRHNPEFTMLEFYTAYQDVNWMMDFCEEMLKQTIAIANNGSLQIRYGDEEIDFSKFQRLTMKEAIYENLPHTEYGDIFDDADSDEFDDEEMSEEFDFNTTSLDRPKFVYAFAYFIEEYENLKHSKRAFRPNMLLQNMGVIVDDRKEESFSKRRLRLWRRAKEEALDNYESSENAAMMAQRIAYIFEAVAEEDLRQPTFITDFPKAISPLSKASPADPTVAERFELYINGIECANGFSELNAPEEQYERFIEQMQQRERGDEEAMVLDEDYIRALAYGMPPAAGIGIGIDRLTMWLTNRHSIRDVILFPHMRPERKVEETPEEPAEQNQSTTEK
ncbi:MAG TPA: lysine--tRNA ligase [Pyrinomonadaceae bacterium]|jgi:lysyl-tRNA synthetase class 2|nr:lysine--tRNA ligase [Pyrinomonadaceae bacterium]